MHESTLKLKLRIMRLAKNVVPKNALYWPTIGQVPQAELLAKSTSSLSGKAQNGNPGVASSQMSRSRAPRTCFCTKSRRRIVSGSQAPDEKNPAPPSRESARR